MQRESPKSVESLKESVNDSPLSLTLRQLQDVLTGPIFWAMIGVAVVLTAMAGPYYTLEQFTFPERLVYWGTSLGLSGPAMTFLSIFAYRVTEARNWNWFAVGVTSGIVGLPLVMGTVYLANGIVRGFEDNWTSWIDPWPLALAVAPTLIATTVLVNGLIWWQHERLAEAQGAEHSAAVEPENLPTQTAPALTSLQSKLPAQLGHDIVTVQARDHYVEVTTPLGQTLILMRLGDAVEDLATLTGMQIHRSWWINLQHISQIDTGANGPEVVMSSGQRIAVGRRYREAFREALQKS